MKYAVIFEPTNTGFSAYVPDFDGCVAAGPTLEETRTLISGALALHIAGMREDGDAIPEPSLCELIEVTADASTP
jgi:predicted RNase H-like HicB family nuclease